MQTPTLDSLQQLRQAIATFAQEREWEPFHSPKNLSMALIVEAAELVEHFQWMTGEESNAIDPKRLAAVRLELADILIYLIRIADRLEVDLIAAANDKIALNQQRYPVHLARGNARRPADFTE